MSADQELHIGLLYEQEVIFMTLKFEGLFVTSSSFIPTNAYDKQKLLIFQLLSMSIIQFMPFTLGHWFPLRGNFLPLSDIL